MYLIARVEHDLMKKEPQMAHSNPAQDELIDEIESLIDAAGEHADEDELAERERRADQVIASVRERVSRRERA